MSAEIHEFRPRPRRASGDHPHVYSAILIRDDVTLAELMHALRFSGIVVSTDPLSGTTYIHRSPPPKGAA